MHRTRIFLIAVPLLLGAALFKAQRARMEHIKSIADIPAYASCSPGYNHDCWEILGATIAEKPFNHRLYVSGYDTAGSGQEKLSLTYDRTTQQLEEQGMSSVGSLGRCETWHVLYKNVDDALLKRYDSDKITFADFCKTNGCAVVIQ